ncbi:MAG: S8 family serine peptidase [Acidobacteriota bacterium]
MSALVVTAAAAELRVHPLVHESLSRSETVEVLLLFSAQVDWSTPTPPFQDHLERRRHAFERMAELARREQGPVLAWLREAGVPHRRFLSVNAAWARVDGTQLASLAQRPELAAVLPNPRVRVQLPLPEAEIDTDHVELGRDSLPDGLRPHAAEPGLERTGATELWARGFTGDSLVVGVADTGMQWSHFALRERYRGNQGPDVDHSVSWHDAIHDSVDSDCPNDSPVPCDDVGHGTHVTGTTVGDDTVDNQVGMAPGATWIGCRNMDEGHGTPASYLECFDFLLAPYPQGGDPLDGDPDLGADVTCHSWGCPPEEGCEPEVFRTALAAHRAAGLLTVVAAGNSGPECGTVIWPPAIEADAFAIGAVNADDAMADLSSRGPAATTGLLKPDLVAPGVSVRSCYAGSDDRYRRSTGTSMAAPHVAGGTALLWSAVPELRGRPDETIELLQRTAYRTLATDGCAGDQAVGQNATWGRGRLDLVQALEHATAPETEVDCGDGLDDDGDRLFDCVDPDCTGTEACPLVVVNRRIALTAAGPEPALATVFDPTCRLFDAPCPDEQRDGVGGELRLPGEMSRPAATASSLWLYWRSGSVELRLSADDDALLLTWR